MFSWVFWDFALMQESLNIFKLQNFTWLASLSLLILGLSGKTFILTIKHHCKIGVLVFVLQGLSSITTAQTVKVQGR